MLALPEIHYSLLEFEVISQNYPLCKRNFNKEIFEKRCYHCGKQLVKIDIYNINNQFRGHAWRCTDCMEDSIGYGDPGEWNPDL